MGLAPTGKRRLVTAHTLSGHLPVSFDHLVGEREQSRRHGEAEALAVLRFRTISNLVGSWTGSSAGFAPRRIELLF